MQVFDEVTKTWVDSFLATKIIIEHLPNQVIFGYTKASRSLVEVLINDNKDTHIYLTDLNTYKGKLYFSKNNGFYFSPVNFNDEFIVKEQLLKGMGRFPYTFYRHYEAVNNFNIFKDRQIIKDTSTEYPLSKYLKYTFGLEFETSQGYIPENICLKDGLIPLRDGSITGIEYSTVVLKGNSGLSLLHQQVESLKEYTSFNKNCSLHVHLGNYPLTEDAIFNLYHLCKSLETELEDILPEYTFYTDKYKDNGKNYCKKLPIYNNFNELYKGLVGRPFFGDFEQPHPNDLERCRKWQILTRYYFVNFINALCYDVNKTIEFRFLRPTYNFKKILLWLYIFNGILKYAEEVYDPGQIINLKMIMNYCYPVKLASEVNFGILKLQILSRNQQLNGDFIGADVWMEDQLFNDLNI